MHSLAAVVALVIGVITLLTLIGAVAVAIVRSSYAKTTIDALRGDVDDLLTRNTFLNEENDRKTAALERQGRELDILRDLVTGKAELAELIHHNKIHEDRAEQRHHDAIAMDEQILETLQEMRAEG